MITKTFALVKPILNDAYRLSDVLHFIEKHHFVIEEMRLRRLSPSDVDVFYQEHVGKTFYEGMKAYTCSGPVAGMILSIETCAEEENAVSEWRNVLGATDPLKAAPCTLRSLYGNKTGIMFQNVAHGSDGPEAAIREASLWGWPLLVWDVYHDKKDART